MIDITCPACDIIYHADETHIGRGLRCKVCGTILLVERQSLGPTAPRQVEHVSATVAGRESSPRTVANRLGLSRDTRIAVGIGVTLIILLLIVWAWLGPPEAKQTASINTEQSASPPFQPPAIGPKSRNLKPITPLKFKPPRLLKPIDPPKFLPVKPSLSPPS